MANPRPTPYQGTENQSKEERQNPEESATTSVQPKKELLTECHSDTVPTRCVENHLRTESAINYADLHCIPMFDLCHTLDTTPGLDFFTDPMFCEALFKVSIDLLPLMFNSNNYNNCNSEIKSLNCFSGVVNLSD